MDKLHVVGGRLLAATGNHGGFPKRFITWDQADKPVVLVDPDRSLIADVDFEHGCYISEQEDRYSLVFDEESQTTLAKERCRFPLMRCPEGVTAVACGDGSVLRWKGGALNLLHPSFTVGDPFAPMDLISLPEQGRYLATYRERTLHPIGEVWEFDGVSGPQRLLLDNLGGFQAANTFPRIVLGSDRLLLLQVTGGTGIGSRLIELERADFRQRRVLFESLRGRPGHSRVRAFDIDNEGVIWLFLDFYRSQRRLCQLVQASEAFETETRWSCSPVEILGEGDRMRNFFLAKQTHLPFPVTALHVSGDRAWFGTASSGVAEAVFYEAKKAGPTRWLRRAHWQVTSWRSVGRYLKGSDRADWSSEKVLTVDNGKLQIR